MNSEARNCSKVVQKFQTLIILHDIHRSGHQPALSKIDRINLWIIWKKNREHPLGAPPRSLDLFVRQHVSHWNANYRVGQKNLTHLACAMRATEKSLKSRNHMRRGKKQKHLFVITATLQLKNNTLWMMTLLFNRFIESSYFCTLLRLFPL